MKNKQNCEVSEGIWCQWHSAVNFCDENT